MSSLSVVGRVFAAAVFVATAAAAWPARAASVEPLVPVQWLKEHLGDPQVVVIDVRSGVPVYDGGHVPGAVHSDYDKAGWRVSRNGVLQPPNQAELEKLIGETGIDEDSHVIVMPAGTSATDFGAAARVYWTLKVAGHPAVSILDGGFAAWQAAAYPIDRRKTVPTPKIFTDTARVEFSIAYARLKSCPMVVLMPSRKDAFPTRFLCWNEPNFTRPIAVANSGWSNADFNPLMELVLPIDTGICNTCSASRAISGMRAPPPQMKTPERR